MIKRISRIMVMLLLIGCLLSCQAFAMEYINPDLPLPNEYLEVWGGDSTGFGGTYISPEISTPVITANPEPYFGTKGEIPYTLRVDASSYDGMLCYQWYMSYTGTYNDLYAIEGACFSSYTPNQILGTSYYCVGVYNVNGELRSEEVFSSIVPVSYAGIQIICPPYKLSYTVGSTLDLRGMAVSVYDGYSSSWQSIDGEGMNAYPSVFTQEGRVAVEVSYNGSSDVLYVNVGAATGAAKTSNGSGDGTVITEDGEIIASDGSHVHSFSEWEVTKPATCVTTGVETRTCECGETETREIPRTDHAWDEGVVTKEATETSNGARLYTCTVCKANKSEIIPAIKSSPVKTPDDIQRQSESLNINGGDPEDTTKNGAVTGTVGQTTTGANGAANVAAGNVNNNGSSNGWWLIPVSALVLVGTGTGAYYVMRKKDGQQ